MGLTNKMENTIIQGDSLEVLKTLPDESTDCCITSPPYNKTGFRGHRDNSVGKGRWSGADIAYGDFKDDMDEQEYQAWQVDILNELYRIIKPNGSIFYNHKVRRNEGKASHPMEWILKSKLNFYQQIIWNRGSGPDHNVNYLDPTTELIFWLTKGTPKVFKTQNRYATEIWSITPDFNNQHPAPFPIVLPEIAILLTTEKDDLVLDPFNGSGTTCIAAQKLGRKYIGIELNPDYIKIAENRLKQEVLF